MVVVPHRAQAFPWSIILYLCSFYLHLLKKLLLGKHDQSLCYSQKIPFLREENRKKNIKKTFQQGFSVPTLLHWRSQVVFSYGIQNRLLSYQERLRLLWFSVHGMRYQYHHVTYAIRPLSMFFSDVIRALKTVSPHVIDCRNYTRTKLKTTFSILGIVCLLTWILIRAMCDNSVCLKWFVD